MSTSLLDTPPQRSTKGPLAAVLGTATVHVGLVVLALAVGLAGARRLKQGVVTEMVEVELPPAPATEPPKPPEPEPEPPRVRAPVAAVPKEPAEPPPEAAQAGQVLTAPDEVVDFGDAMVTGSGANYAGGTTESGGTATHAVREAGARAGGVPGGKGSGLPAPPPVDRSRAPRLAGGAKWDCPFPPEADDLGINSATVSLRVEVSPAGKVLDVTPTADPGNGFGRVARRCALSKRWEAGLDKAGKTTGSVALVKVRFAR